jgi:hypothetical protein
VPAAPTMVDFYEEKAATALSISKVASPAWAEAHEEVAAELLALSNLARRGGIPEE